MSFRINRGIWQFKKEDGTFESKYKIATDGRLVETDAVGNEVSTFGGAASWDSITGKPSTFTPSAHNHDDRYYTETEVNTLLAGKQASGSYITSNAALTAITTSAWAGTSGYHGYTYSGGNYRFGFSSTGGVVDVYADGNFYAQEGAKKLATEEYVTTRGYITGYSETDTLATVTARGATTSSRIYADNGVHVRGDWVRVNGSNGLYFESYGGGWHMTDSSYLKPYNGKSINMVNASIDYVTQLHFNDNVRFYDEGNNQYLNYKWGNSGAGGIKFVDGDGSLQGYVYGSGDGSFGFLDGNGNWKVRVDTGSVEMYGTQYLTTVYANIIYDRDNSNYYINPASTSRFSVVDPDRYNGFVDRAYVDFTVDGDANTYYIVRIQGAAHYGFHRYSISRGYSWTAPNTWNTASHRGGLTFSFEWSGDTAWGGNDKSFRVIEFGETYTTMVAGMALPVTGGIVVWLRGGGAQYRLHSPAGYAASVTVEGGNFTAGNGAVFTPRTDTSNVTAEIYGRWPVRNDNELYVGTNAVVHAGNISSQSVSYATSSGNSTTTSQRSFDYIYGTSYLESAGAIYGTIFYDNNDRAYYLDPNSGSRLNAITYDNLYWAGDTSYGFIGRNVYADTVNGRGTDPLELNYYDGGPVKIGSGTYGSKELYASMVYVSGGNTVIHAGNIGSQSVNYATSAGNSDTVDGYHESAFWRDGQDRRIGILRFTGEGGNSGNGAIAYGIYQEGGAWTHPYPNLRINMHTGISFGANASYGGYRFMSDYNTDTVIFSINDGDANVRVTNNLYIGSAGGWITDLLAGKQAAGSYAAASHTHDDRYYTESEVNTLLAGKQNTGSYLTGNQTITLSGDVSGSGTTSISVTVNNIDGWGFVNTGSNSATNADTINSNGISYYTSGVTNFSGNATDGALYSQRYSDSWQHQIAGDYRSGQIALRGKNNGTWQAWRTVIDSGNIGSQRVDYANTAGSAPANGGNSNTVAGLAVHSGRNNEANKVVRTDANGYIQAGWINTPSGATTSTLTKIYASQDDYVRYVTPTEFRRQITDGVYAAASHNHPWSQITDAPTKLSAFTNDLGNYGGFLTSIPTHNLSSHSNDGTYNIFDNWLRENGDNNNFRIYGNSRMVIFRTDGTAGGEGHTGYPFNFRYGGDATSNTLMLLDTSGNVWTKSYGWLHTRKWESASSADTALNLNATNVYTTGNNLYIRNNGVNNYRIHHTGGVGVFDVTAEFSIREMSSIWSATRYVWGNYMSYAWFDVDPWGDNWGIGSYPDRWKTVNRGSFLTFGIDDYSDRRSKSAIIEIDNAVDKVKAISGYTYWKVGSEVREAGVVAQDVLAVFPEATGGSEEGYSVKPSALIGLLMKAVKEQQETIEALTARIEQLENK